MIRSLFSSVVIIILSGGGGLAHDEIQTAQWEATTKRTLDFIQRNLSIPLPEWALRIPDYNDGLMNFTVSFLNFLTKERSCSLEGNIFGKNCGMCAHDCTFLREALGEERLVEDDPEVIILSPVMAERKRTDPRGDQYLRIRALLALPAPPLPLLWARDVGQVKEWPVLIYMHSDGKPDETGDSREKKRGEGRGGG